MQAAIPSVQAIIDLKSVRPREKLLKNKDSIVESPFEDGMQCTSKVYPSNIRMLKIIHFLKLISQSKKVVLWLGWGIGSWKKYFHRYFSGLIQPTSGELHVKNKLSIKSRYWRKRIGYVPKNLIL